MFLCSLINKIGNEKKSSFSSLQTFSFFSRPVMKNLRQWILKLSTIMRKFFSPPPRKWDCKNFNSHTSKRNAFIWRCQRNFSFEYFTLHDWWWNVFVFNLKVWLEKFSMFFLLMGKLLIVTTLEHSPFTRSIKASWPLSSRKNTPTYGKVSWC